MAHPSGDHPPRYPTGVAALIERGTLIPARRCLSEVLRVRPPLKLQRRPVTAARGLDEQRRDRD
ncbi:MAG: hypothetical protein JWR63_1008 [Conexibacter sp.]|nr:hypothetical protein [Conexibacter sp.]